MDEISPISVTADTQNARVRACVAVFDMAREARLVIVGGVILQGDPKGRVFFPPRHRAVFVRAAARRAEMIIM